MDQIRDVGGALAASIPHKVAHARQTIAHEGEVSDHCYLVMQGVLRCSMSAPNGKRQIVGFHVAGDICGNVASATDALDYSIEALSDATFVAIRTQSLTDMIDGSQLLGDAFRRHIMSEAAISRQWILNIGQRPAYHRLAHLICEIEARLRAVGLAEHGAFRWYGTQSDFGAATGLSLVHTNKTLAALERDGLVAWRGRTLRIGDLERLSTIAEFDPTYLRLDQQSLGRLLSFQSAACHDAIHDATHEGVERQTEPHSVPRLRSAQAIA